MMGSGRMQIIPSANMKKKHRVPCQWNHRRRKTRSECRKFGGSIGFTLSISLKKNIGCHVRRRFIHKCLKRQRDPGFLLEFWTYRDF
jgi:hypothetical protein